MRRRKVKGADIKLLSYKDYVLRDNIEALKGNWNKLFKNDNPIYAEFGTGRGKFLTTLAKQNPDINYIAFEIKEEVLIKGVEKAEQNNLKNIIFAWADVSKALDYFDTDELSRIYINFCDPWPKKRHAKRRLTHPDYLRGYANILKEEGQIIQKTDNRALFDYSLECYEEELWNISSVDYDYKGLDSDVATEYETKFRSLGTPINRAIIVKGDDTRGIK